MNLYESMQSKFGFGDGDAMPAQAWAARDVYVAAINNVAARLGSGVRIVKFNRCGMHNACMVLTVKADCGLDLAAEHESVGNAALADQDDQMQDAIAQCYELELDQFIHVEVEADVEGAVGHVDQEMDAKALESP